MHNLFCFDQSKKYIISKMSSLYVFFRRINRLKVKALYEQDPVKKAQIEKTIVRLLDLRNEELLRKINEIVNRIDEQFEIEIQEYLC